MDHTCKKALEINLFTDLSFCIFKKKKKKASEIAILVVNELCPGSWLESCSVALARDGENWQESGVQGVEKLISIFRASKNCSILEQLLLLRWKYITNQAHEHISWSVITYYNRSTWHV